MSAGARADGSLLVWGCAAGLGRWRRLRLGGRVGWLRPGRIGCEVERHSGKVASCRVGAEQFLMLGPLGPRGAHRHIPGPETHQNRMHTRDNIPKPDTHRDARGRRAAARLDCLHRRSAGDQSATHCTDMVDRRLIKLHTAWDGGNERSSSSGVGGVSGEGGRRRGSSHPYARASVRKVAARRTGRPP